MQIIVIINSTALIICNAGGGNNSKAENKHRALDIDQQEIPSVQREGYCSRTSCRHGFSSKSAVRTEIICFKSKVTSFKTSPFYECCRERFLTQISILYFILLIRKISACGKVPSNVFA